MGLNQYDVVLVNLNPTKGSEIKKTRPCVIISPDVLNKHLNTIVIAPMTTSLKNYPTRVVVYFNDKEGRIAVDQIRTIDAQRVIKNLGHIKDKEIDALKVIIKQTFVD